MRLELPLGIRMLLDPDRVDGLRLELKANDDKPCLDAVTRTVAAFANDLHNANGGYIVLGVQEDQGRPVLPAAGIPTDELDAAQSRVLAACRRIVPTYLPTMVIERLDAASLIVLRCPAGDNGPYRAPDRGGELKPWVRVGSSTVEARDDLWRQLQEAATRTPFDDRACPEATVDDLMPELLHAHLRHARSRLADHPISSEVWRQLNLVRRPNGHDVPRNVAALFFCYEPTRFLPGAKVEVAVYPGGRHSRDLVEETFAGPIPQVVRSTLEHLRGLNATRVHKHADRAEADRIDAWPFAAIEEALVNAVHHRGYDNPHPVKVDVLPDALMITSHPGPVPGVSREALERGDASAAPPRNRRIVELLKDIRLAEGRGTGLSLIRRAMHESGNPPPTFEFDDARTWFRVTLPIHPAHRPAPAAAPLRTRSPAPAEEVVGRDGLITRLWTIAARQSVLLTAPVGRGCTSLLARMEAGPPSGTHALRLDCTGLGLRHGLRREVAAWKDEHDGRLVLLLDNLDAAAFLREDHAQWLEFLTGDRPRVIGVVADPALRVFPRPADILAAVRLLPLPPLDRPDAATLAGRLLRGCGIEPTATMADAVAETSAGLPRLVHLLVQRMAADRRTDDVAGLLDELLVAPGDPTGLRARTHELRTRLERAGDAERAVVAAVASGPRRRPELLAALGTSGLPRLDALEAARTLELEGWIVEADGELRLEHPCLWA
jgi:predicted HTH transcriptional regulator